MRNLRPGDIVFVMHSKSLLSRTIAWFMQSKFSHCAVVIGADRHRTYICETTNYEVSIGYLEIYLDDPTVSLEVWSPVAMARKDRQKVCYRCLENCGDLYGYLQLLSFAVRALLKRVGIKIPNFIRQGIVCDENVLTGYALSKATLLYAADPKSMETQELYELVSDSEKFKLVLAKAKGAGGLLGGRSNV